MTDRTRDRATMCDMSEVGPGGDPERPLPTAPRIDDIRVYRPSFAGMIGLACVPFAIWATLGVYGVAVALVLTVWWLFLITLGMTWFMRYPRRLPVLAVLAFAAWGLAIWLG